ncbi:MAG TPA: glycine zipper domain-containing protein [Candidatus Binatia bacterium]
MKKSKAHALAMLFLVMIAALAAGCSRPPTTREQGALVGGGLGLATGSIVGHAVGHTTSGALIGGPIGLLAGALIGDKLMEQEYRQYRQDREIARLRREVEELRRENEYLRGH